MISYCINLPERPEKWAAATREFKKLRGNVLKFTATKEAIGFDGCRKSHLHLLNHHLATYGDELFTVYEDDVQFTVNDPQFAIDKILRDVPDDWDMLYLGATLTEPVTWQSGGFYRLRNAWTTHAMIFNNQNGVVDYILENNGGGRKIDVFYAQDVQHKFNCYIPSQILATQRNGFSDILNKNVNNGNIILDYFKRYTR